MYRQRLLDKGDQLPQKAVKESPSSPLKHYRMTRNRYGALSAGFDAILPLLQLAETTKHPVASFALTFDMHVDDLLTGASSQMEAKALQDVLIEHLATTGFQLRKCVGNYQETAFTTLIEARECFIKSFSAVWKPKHDIIAYNVN